MIFEQLDSINSVVRRMGNELAVMKEAQRESGAASSIGDRQIVGPKQFDAMMQVKKSLERAASSCDKGALFAQAISESLRAEGQVIRGAYEALDTLVTDAVRNSMGF